MLHLQNSIGLLIYVACWCCQNQSTFFFHWLHQNWWLLLVSTSTNVQTIRDLHEHPSGNSARYHLPPNNPHWSNSQPREFPLWKLPHDNFFRERIRVKKRVRGIAQEPVNEWDKTFATHLESNKLVMKWNCCKFKLKWPKLKYRNKSSMFANARDSRLQVVMPMRWVIH